MAPKRAAAKTSGRAKAKAAAGWLSHCQESGKAKVTDFIQKNPDKLAFLEKFIEAQLWEQPTTVVKKVARFCRGRTVVSKIPPTFTAKLWEKHTGIKAEVWQFLHKKSQDLLPRSYTFAAAIAFDSNIGEIMDRRTKVFEELMEDRMAVFGNRLSMRAERIMALYTEVKEQGKTKMDWEWPWQHIGVFECIYKEGRVEHEKDRKLVKLRHVSGAEAWPTDSSTMMLMTKQTVVHKVSMTLLFDLPVSVIKDSSTIMLMNSKNCSPQCFHGGLPEVIVYSVCVLCHVLCCGGRCARGLQHHPGVEGDPQLGREGHHLAGSIGHQRQEDLHDLQELWL